MANQNLSDPDSEDIELNNFDKEVKFSIWIAVSSFIAVYLIYIVFFFFNKKIIIPDSGAWGQFGDFVGGVLNPIVAGLAFYWLVKSMQLQKSELSDTRAVMSNSVRQQSKQTSLVRKQNIIAELEICASILLVQLEGLQTERIGISNRIITVPKPNSAHYLYSDSNGKNLTLPEAVNKLDAEILKIKHELDAIREKIKGINKMSNVEKILEKIDSI